MKEDFLMVEEQIKAREETQRQYRLSHREWLNPEGTEDEAIDDALMDIVMSDYEKTLDV